MQQYPDGGTTSVLPTEQNPVNLFLNNFFSTLEAAKFFFVSAVGVISVRHLFQNQHAECITRYLVLNLEVT
jgi:hypothetical protein